MVSSERGQKNHGKNMKIGPRTNLPRAVEYKVRKTSLDSCCICKKDGIQIHHLDGNRNNNRFENLAPLCPNHHARADLRSPMIKNLTPDFIRYMRDEWYKECQQRSSSSKTMSQSQKSNAVDWAFYPVFEDRHSSNPHSLTLAGSRLTEVKDWIGSSAHYRAFIPLSVPTATISATRYSAISEPVFWKKNKVIEFPKKLFNALSGSTRYNAWCITAKEKSGETYRIGVGAKNLISTLKSNLDQNCSIAWYLVSDGVQYLIAGRPAQSNFIFSLHASLSVIPIGRKLATLSPEGEVNFEYPYLFEIPNQDANALPVRFWKYPEKVSKPSVAELSMMPTIFDAKIKGYYGDPPRESAGAWKASPLTLFKTLGEPKNLDLSTGPLPFIFSGKEILSGIPLYRSSQTFDEGNSFAIKSLLLETFWISLFLQDFDIVFYDLRFGLFQKSC